MWNLKYDPNEPIHEIETEIITPLVVAKGEGCRGGTEWEVGISRRKLLFMEQINKVLPYSTENYIQYPVINHNGKEH